MRSEKLVRCQHHCALGGRRKLQGFQYPEVFQRGLRFLIDWQCVYIGDASSRSALSISRTPRARGPALCLVTPQLYRLFATRFSVFAVGTRGFCVLPQTTHLCVVTLSTSCVVTTRGHVCALSGNLSRILANGGLCASWQKQLWPKGIALRGCAAAHETSERAPSDVLQ